MASSFFVGTVLLIVFAATAAVVRGGMIPAVDEEVDVACEGIMSSFLSSSLPLRLTWIVLLILLLLVGVLNKLLDVSFLSCLGKL